MRNPCLLLLALFAWGSFQESAAQQCTVAFNPTLNPQTKVVACEDVTFAFLSSLFTDAAGVTVSCPGTAPCTYTLHSIVVTHTVLPVCTGGLKEIYTRNFTFVCPGGSTTCGQPNVVCGSQTIQVTDTEAPSYENFPADVTVACEAWDLTEYLNAIDWSLQPSDNCSVNFTEDQDFNVVQTCPSEPEFQWTFTLTDECGNSAQRTHTVSIEDGTAPTLLFNPPVAEPFTCAADVVWPTPYATDGCDPNPTAYWISDPVTLDITCPDRITLLRTARAEDGCGNTVEGDFILEVFDDIAPDFGNYNPSFQVELGEPVVFPDLQAVDGCGGPVFVIQEADTSASAGCASGEVITMTYSAADLCGNIATAIVTANIADSQGPLFDSLEEVALECSLYPDGQIHSTAQDVSGVASLVILFDTPLSSSSCAGNPDLFERHYLATDSCGNTREGVQLIRLIDTTPPVFAQPLGPLVLDCTDFSEETVPQPEVIDSCSAVTLTFVDEESPIPGNCSNGTFRMRLWTATDACGNSSTAEQSIEILDLTGPEITFNPPAAPVFACVEEVVWPELSAEDSCSGVVELVWLGPPTITNFICEDQLTFTRTARATDGCGNATEVDFSVEVFDNQPPVFQNVPAEQTVEFTENLVLPVPAVTDNCAGPFTLTTVLDTLPGALCPGTFDVQATFTAVDGCENTATATTLFHVEDTQGPVVTGAAEVFINCENYPDPTLFAEAQDPSGLVSLEVLSETETAEGGCIGQFERVYLAVDSCGNETEFTQLITLLDAEDPVFSFVPADTAVSCVDLPLLELQIPAVSDNCDLQPSIDITYDDTYSIPGCYGTFTRIRTWTATDACGNSTSASQTISVTDSTAPIVTGEPEGLVFECITDVPSCAAYFGDFTFSPDGCPGAIGLDCSTASSGDCTQGPCTQTWTYTFDDGCGNTSVASVNVQITNSYGNPVFQTGLTPNNDGYNDTYTIGNIGPQLGTATPCDWLPFTEFAVFTRWGQRVFVASDYRNSWDGTDSDGNPLPDGTYFAVFTHNGSSYSSFIDIRR